MCHTQLLDLSLNKIGNAGLTALAKAVESGALPALEQLDLTLNQIGDDGLKALAEACASGALASLTTLVVDNSEHPALNDACQARDIDLL